METEDSLDKGKDFLKCGIHAQWTIIQPLNGIPAFDNETDGA